MPSDREQLFTKSPSKRWEQRNRKDGDYYNQSRFHTRIERALLGKETHGQSDYSYPIKPKAKQEQKIEGTPPPPKTAIIDVPTLEKESEVDTNELKIEVLGKQEIEGWNELSSPDKVLEFMLELNSNEDPVLVTFIIPENNTQMLFTPSFLDRLNHNAKFLVWLQQEKAKISKIELIKNAGDYYERRETLDSISLERTHKVFDPNGFGLFDYDPEIEPN